MPTMTLTFAKKIQSSAQVGDMILYSNPASVGGFSTSAQSDVVMLGACLTIAANRLSMTVDYQLNTAFPTTSSFILNCLRLTLTFLKVVNKRWKLWLY